MLDTSPLRLSVGENVETLLRAHFILVSLCTFSLFPGSRAIGSKTPKKKKFLKRTSISNSLPLDEENWFGWVIPKESLGIILSKYRD